MGGIVSPEHLTACDVVTIASAAVSRTLLALQGNGETVDVPVRPILRTNNAEVLVHALREGRGIGPVQLLLVAEDLTAGRLVRVLPDYTLRSTEAFLVYPSTRHMRPAVRAFTDFAVPRIRALAGIGQTP